MKYVLVLIALSLLTSHSAFSEEDEAGEIKKIFDCDASMDPEHKLTALNFPVPGKKNEFYFVTPKNILHIKCGDLSFDPPMRMRRPMEGSPDDMISMSKNYEVSPALTGSMFARGKNRLVVGCGQNENGHSWVFSVAENSIQSPIPKEFDIANTAEVKKLAVEALQKRLDSMTRFKRFDKESGLSPKAYQVCNRVVGLKNVGEARQTSGLPAQDAAKK